MKGANYVRHRQVLLIGAGGQVGRELERSLQPLGEVICAARQLDHRSSIKVDLAEPESIREAVRTIDPALIVNAAAYTAVDRAETECDLAWKVNAVAPGILAEEAARLHAALVHYSTDYVFDGSGQHPWHEDDPTGPLNHYGATKLAGEEAIRAVNPPHLILRVSWVYGQHGANFVKTMLRLGREREELTVVADQIGAPTSAQAIAEATTAILAQGGEDWIASFRELGGTVHMTCQGYTSWHAFAELIFELARQKGWDLAVRGVRPITTQAYPTPAKRPLNSRMSCQRLWERFGLKMPRWQDSLQQFLNIEPQPL